MPGGREKRRDAALETGKKKRCQLAGLRQGAGIAEQRQLRALLARRSWMRTRRCHLAVEGKESRESQRLKFLVFILLCFQDFSSQVYSFLLEKMSRLLGGIVFWGKLESCILRKIITDPCKISVPLPFPGPPSTCPTANPFSIPSARSRTVSQLYSSGLKRSRKTLDVFFSALVLQFPPSVLDYRLLLLFSSLPPTHPLSSPFRKQRPTDRAAGGR